jgi:hypothetical protein
VDTSFQDWHYARSQIGVVQVPGGLILVSHKINLKTMRQQHCSFVVKFRKLEAADKASQAAISLIRTKKILEEVLRVGLSKPTLVW